VKYKLNLGCGTHIHPEWINIDMTAVHPAVRVHDLRKGIPFADGSCEVVYHSHLLEHIPFADALPFMRECYRALESKGILRVAAPDLERICRVYTEKLEEVLSGETQSDADYEWVLLELLDQMVRETGGGRMRAYLTQDQIPNPDFVLSRIGEGGRAIMQAAKKTAPVNDKTEADNARIHWIRLTDLLKKIPYKARNLILKMLYGNKGSRALQVGFFRMSGEVHQWMYDRYSLRKLMLNAGFAEPIVQTATKSFIPHWTDYHLDSAADGTVYKPDSLFMESRKR
jgi:predicted SAM-dependent methyltransferase